MGLWNQKAPGETDLDFFCRRTAQLSPAERILIKKRFKAMWRRAKRRPR